MSRGSRKPSRSGATFSRIALGDDTSSDAQRRGAERAQRILSATRGSKYRRPARRTLGHLPAACGGSLADMAPGALAAAVVADAEPDDVAMLDGNTIEIMWPQTTRKNVAKMRKNVGTVRYRPAQQRNRFENGYLVEFERRPGTPRTAKGPRLRKTRWEKLRGRKYVVLRSTVLPKPAGARWTPEEIEAVRVRIEAGETQASIGRGIGRSKDSVSRCSKRFRPGYAPQSTGGPRVKSGVTVELVESAMLTLPENEGTVVEVFEAVKQQAATEGVALSLEIAPGQSARSRAEASVGTLLGDRRGFPQFSATGEKRLSNLQIDKGDKKTKSRKSAVYKYSPPIVTAEREPGLPSTKRVRAHTPNVGGPKKSARKTKELLAGGDRRHG